ncbi:MAG: ATP-dependent helicase [Lachnospiraceae bacterium]
MILNESQREAVQYKGGPLLVLAGPGSGKTLVITERTKYLIQEEKVPPEQILVISFTRASAKEMKERFLRLMDQRTTTVSFGTFHSIFFSILKRAYHYQPENIVKEEVRFQLIAQIIQQLRLECEDEAEMAGNLLGEISLVKNLGINLDHYYAKSCGEEEFRMAFSKYQEFMRQNHYIDFDDMLIYTYELLTERKDILAGWQKKFRYILIDEFQDINKIQFDVIQLLAEPENHIFAVGDDDQSIYRFRGAKPEIMLGFQACYTDAKRIILDVNYRSQKEIVASTQNLIVHNSNRYGKEMKAALRSEGPVEFKLYQDEKQESKEIIQSIQRSIQDGTLYNDITVLVRTNTQARYFTEKLMEYNIPFRMKERMPNIYDHFIAKDVLAYLRLGAGSRARSDFLRIMNRPTRYLSRQSLYEGEVNFNHWKEYYEKAEQFWMVKRVKELYEDIEAIHRLSPFAAINYIRKGIGYDAYLREYAEKRNMNEAELLEILEELQLSAKEYLTLDEWSQHIEEFKETLAAQNRGEVQSDAITIATLHASKGLEYDTVYIMDVNEGIMPYKKAILSSDLEEERRMFYVGMTRAKHKLYLSAVKMRNNHEIELSRFIKEAGVL